MQAATGHRASLGDHVSELLAAFGLGSRGRLSDGPVARGRLGSIWRLDTEGCTPTVVSAGEGYVDSGHDHIGRNESGQPAVDVSVIMAPVGLPFRAEFDAPGPHCGF
jgi:hypothetical protein